MKCTKCSKPIFDMDSTLCYDCWDKHERLMRRWAKAPALDVAGPTKGRATFKCSKMDRGAIQADAFNRVKAWCHSIRKHKTPRPLWLCLKGFPGVGKTHMLCCASNYLTYYDIPHTFQRFGAYLDYCTNARRNGGNSYEEIVGRKKSPMILDEIGVEARFDDDDEDPRLLSEYSEAKFNATNALFDYALNHKIPMLLATNLGTAQIPAYLGARIAGPAGRFAEAGYRDFYCDWKDYRSESK